MSIYGNLRTTANINESVEDLALVEFTQQELIEIQEFVIEGYESLEESSEDILNEGANIEYTKAFKDAYGKYRSAIKDTKKALKSKNYKDAKAGVKEAKKAVDGLEKAIKSVDSDAGSAVFGYFAASIVQSLQMIIPTSLMNTGVKLTGLAVGAESKALAAAGLGTTMIGYIAALIKGTTILIKDIKQFINDLDNKETTANTLNLYRNKLLGFVTDLKKNVDKLDKIVAQREKDGK